MPALAQLLQGDFRSHFTFRVAHDTQAQGLNPSLTRWCLEGPGELLADLGLIADGSCALVEVAA